MNSFGLRRSSTWQEPKDVDIRSGTALSLDRSRYLPLCRCYRPILRRLGRIGRTRVLVSGVVTNTLIDCYRLLSIVLVRVHLLDNQVPSRARCCLHTISIQTEKVER